MSRRRVYAETLAGGPAASLSPSESNAAMQTMNHMNGGGATTGAPPRQRMIDGLMQLGSSSSSAAGDGLASSYDSYSSAQPYAAPGGAPHAASYALPEQYEEDAEGPVHPLDAANDDIFMGQALPGMVAPIPTAHVSSAQRPTSRQGSSVGRNTAEQKLAPLTGDADIAGNASSLKPSGSHRSLGRMGSSSKVQIDLGSMSKGSATDLFYDRAPSVAVPRVDGGDGSGDFAAHRANSFASRSKSGSKQGSSNRLNGDSASWPPNNSSSSSTSGEGGGGQGPSNNRKQESNQLGPQDPSVQVVKISAKHPMRLVNTPGAQRASNRAIAGVEMYSSKVKATSAKYNRSVPPEDELEDPNGSDCMTNICLMFR